MDAIFIKEKGLLATCGLDKKIKLWGIENLRPRGTLLGHKLGVRAISYAQSVLISGGFDNEAIVWDITSHEILCTMSGHQHAIGTVEIIAPSAESVCVVTLDDSGECRYWRLTNHGSRVECIDCFKLPFTDPSGPTRSVVMPWNRKHVVDDFPDLFFGGSRVYHMVPVKTMREFAPPSSSIYNSTSYQFVSAVGNTVHVWDSRTGRYLERFRVDKREISSMCFDMPRMRRVFLGTESGAIATLNYVTGEVLAVCAAHDREVSGLVFCELTKCVISYGADRRLHVLKDVKSSLSVLRTAENARKGATLTCLAYSAPLSLIATGDSEGGLVLWDFQTLQQHALIRLEGPAAACAVLDPYPLLATGDTDGVVRLWQLGLDAGYVTVDPLCVMGPPEDGTIGNPAAADRRPGSPARESNSTPSITGLAFLHKHRLHDGAAIEGSFKGDRARRATLRHLSADAAKSASTRELDKYDGEVLVASTDAGTLACWHFDFVHAEFPHRTLPVLEAERAARARNTRPRGLGNARARVDVDGCSDAPFDVSAEGPVRHVDVAATRRPAAGARRSRRTSSRTARCSATCSAATRRARSSRRGPATARPSPRTRGASRTTSPCSSASSSTARRASTRRPATGSSGSGTRGRSARSASSSCRTASRTTRSARSRRRRTGTTSSRRRRR